MLDRDPNTSMEYNSLLLKCKISAIYLVDAACIFLKAKVQISMECKTPESQAGYTKILNLH